MLHIKRGASVQASSVRSVLFRHQANTAYAIHMVRHFFLPLSVINDNENVAVALSIRFEDQVTDTGVVPTLEFATEQGIFAVGGYTVDFAGATGALGFITSDTIPFTLPYLVPYAAWLLNGEQILNFVSIGVEVFFERVRVTNLELAQLVNAAGGRIQTS